MAATRGLRRRLLAGLVALTLLGTGAAATAEPATKGPGLRLVARASEPVVLQRQPGAWVWLELGTYLVAGRQPLEVWARRAGYDQPVLADQVVGSGPARHRERLPAGMVDSLRSFNAVWGLPPGWGAPSTNPWYSQQVDLPDGDYTAEVEVNQRYRDLFGVPAGQASATVRFSVRTSPGAASAAAARALPGRPVVGHGLPGQAANGQAGRAGAAASRAPAAAPPGAGQSPGAAQPDAGQAPAGAQPAGPGTLAGVGGRGGRFRPDLRPLPAWAIWLDNSSGRSCSASPPRSGTPGPPAWTSRAPAAPAPT